MRKKWKESLKKWKEDPEGWMEGTSPDGKKRKEMKREKEAHWGLLRECTSFIKENTERWEKRTGDETKRIRAEEKVERLDRAKQKQEKYRNKVKIKEEEEKLKMNAKQRTNEILELAEIRKNLWKNYRNEDGNPVEVKVKKIASKKINFKEWKTERNGALSSLTEYYREEKRQKEKEKEDRLAKIKKLKESWELTKLCLEFLEKSE